MTTAEARIDTTKASRYLAQLCQHAKKFGGRHPHPTATRPDVLAVEWTDTDGTLTLSWGTCRLHADDDTLTVQVEAPDEDSLKRVQDIVAADLERFGRLAVTWVDTVSGV
jgi:hypothetical protein